MFGYTTIALPQWKNETNVELRFDDNESSLFASSIYMIAIICSPIGGILSGWLGRRKLILVATPLVICGWLITGFAQNKIMLFVGRIISGGKTINTRHFMGSTNQADPQKTSTKYIFQLYVEILNVGILNQNLF